MIETYAISGSTISFESQMPLCEFDAESGKILNWLPEISKITNPTIACNSSHLIICMHMSVIIFDRRGGKICKFIKEIKVNESRCIYSYDLE